MPAANPDKAQEKWERKTSGTKWKQGLAEGDSYSEGLADFWGGDASDYSQAEGTWSEEVGEVSASDFNSRISGKGSKWARNARRGARNSNE